MRGGAVFLLACAWASVAFGVRAPLSMAFSEWQEAGAPRGGLIPSPTDRSHLGAVPKSLSSAATRKLKAAATLPSRWDSREKGWLTPIRNQNPYGTCWTFSTMACLETAILKSSAGEMRCDLSENHMATHDVGFAWGYDDGGNNEMAAALLTAWRDPLNEAEDPYPNPGRCVDLPPVRHVQDVVWLPAHGETAGYDKADFDAYKRAIMDYGAISIGYIHCWNHYNEETGAHYVKESDYRDSGGDGGHSVTVIGWDDDYPVANFLPLRHPPGPGAFLIKNSWGASSGTNGCMWISYYNDFFAYMTPAAYSVPESTNNFGRVYQYDPCGQVTSWNVYENAADQAAGGKENWCANVFTAKASGVVEAIGFYSLGEGAEYEVRVYGDCETDPSSGRLYTSQSGTVAHAGFVTVRLELPVPIRSAERFAVVLHLETPGYDYPIPVEASMTDYCTATAAAGESFLSPDGERWTDFQKYDTTANICLKAYTRFGSEGVETNLIASVTPTEDSLALWVGETRSFEVVPIATDPATELTYQWMFAGRLLDCTLPRCELTPSLADHGNRVLSCLVSCGGQVTRHEWSVAVNAELEVSDTVSLTNALAAAIAGDRVLCSPGVYAGGIEAPYAPIEIRSAEGPEKTVIDGSAAGWCYSGAYSADTVLSGFTLCNASLQDDVGAGAYAAWLENCIVSNCVAAQGGGAYACVLDTCLVTDCRAVDGGGAYGCHEYNCTVVGNSASRFGGGAVLPSGAETMNSIFAGNSSNAGAAYGNDVYGDGVRSIWTSLVGGDAGFADMGQGDYRLSVRSPAIDLGLNEVVGTLTDLDGLPRICGARVDLGCYEYSHDAAGWPVPEIRVGATPEEERAAVASALLAQGFSQDVADAIPTRAHYLRLSAWAEGNGVSACEMAGSAVPILSSALGADRLLGIEPSALNVRSIAALGDGHYLLGLRPPGYDQGRVDPELLAAAIGVKGADSVGGGYTAKGMDCWVWPLPDSIGVEVAAPTNAPAYFLRSFAR